MAQRTLVTQMHSELIQWGRRRGNGCAGLTKSLLLQQPEHYWKHRLLPILVVRPTVDIPTMPGTFHNVLVHVAPFQRIVVEALGHVPSAEMAHPAKPVHPCRSGISILMNPHCYSLQHTGKGAFGQSSTLRWKRNIVLQHEHALSYSRGGIAHGHAHYYADFISLEILYLRLFCTLLHIIQWST